MTLDEAKKVKVGDKVIARVGALSLPVECEVINIIPGIERIKFDLDYQSEDGKWKHVKRTHMRCWKIREILEQDKDVSNETRSALSDRRPSKLTRLNLISVKMSTPEQMLEAYNSLVDAYNTLIDGYNKLNESKPVGEWVYEDRVAGMRYYRCTNCTSGYETLADENEAKWWRFCPRCGSKMFTKEEKND